MHVNTVTGSLATRNVVLCHVTNYLCDWLNRVMWVGFLRKFLDENRSKEPLSALLQSKSSKVKVKSILNETH